MVVLFLFLLFLITVVSLFLFFLLLITVVVLFLFFLLLITVIFALVLLLVAVVVLAFLVVVFALFGLVVLELQRRLGVGSLDHDAGDVVAQRFERALQPWLQFDAVHRDDVGLSDRDEVARRELEGMPLRAGGHEGDDFHPVAADSFGEVLHRVDARDHAQRLECNDRCVRGWSTDGRVRGLRVIRAGDDRHRQRSGDEQHV